MTMIDQVLSFICARGEPAWLVGGFVRDRLLDRPTHDLDVIVPDDGIRLARAVANAFGGAFFVLDDERDVARAVLEDAAGESLEVDVARLRAPDLLDDLSLRDFTINAMAASITDCEAACRTWRADYRPVRRPCRSRQATDPGGDGELVPG